MDIELFIDTSGNIKTIYEDEIVPVLATIGRVKTARASRVEPRAVGWNVTIRTTVGKYYYNIGNFTTRSEALARERRWLSDYWTSGFISSTINMTSKILLKLKRAPFCDLLPMSSDSSATIQTDETKLP
jgi:hypothetical protein